MRSPSSTPQPDDRDEAAVVVRYSLDADERPSEAIPAALTAADVDLTECETVLHDWIDGDAVDKLLGGADPAHRLSTVVWNRPVDITAETVTVYET